MLGVPVAERSFLTLVVQFLGGVLPQALEHRELNRRSVGEPLMQEALVHQRRGGRRDVDAGFAADRLGRVHRPATDEDRQPPEQHPVGRRQQLVAPLHCGEQGAVAGWDVARAAGQYGHAVTQPQGQLAWGEHPQACSSELERQGQPVEPDADLGDGVGVVDGEPKARGHGTGTREQQGDGVVRHQGTQVGGRCPRRHVQGRYGVLVLGGHAQALTAGGDETQPGATAEQGSQLRPGVQHVVEVVQKDQQLAMAEELS